MRVSVAIVAKHAEKTIEHCIEGLFVQTVKPHEIIVVVDSLMDPTVKVVENLPVKMVVNEGVGLGAARRTAVNSSAEDIITFIDADCIADRRWIGSVVENFSRSDVVAQAGLVINVRSLSELSNTIGSEANFKSSMRLEFAPTMNFAIKRELIKTVGNFDAWFKEGGEDLDYYIRLRGAGYKIYYNSDAIVYHLTHGYGLRRAWRDGRSRAQAFCKHKSAIMGDTLTCLFHIASLFGAILLLAIGYHLWAIIFFAPSLLHRTYRATVSVRRGNSATSSLLNSFGVYISYLSFALYLTKLMLASLASLML